MLPRVNFSKPKYFCVGVLIGVNLFHFFIWILGILNHNVIVEIHQRQTYQLDHFESKISDELFHKVKVLCWIMISPSFHRTRGIHVKNTWGQRCNKLIFMSSENDAELGAIALPVQEGKAHLWSKTTEAFKHINEHHIEQYDWFLKADDDTSMIMENLRHLLFQYNPKTALYFGQRLVGKKSLDGYMQGGAYVLSRKALKKFIQLNPNCRKKDGWAEDLYMGKCLTNKTIFVDTRDNQKQDRFLMFGIEKYFPSVFDPTNWFFEKSFYGIRHGTLSCCSDKPIGFHYIKEISEMYLLEYLTRHVHPFGVDKGLNEMLPRILTIQEILKAADIGSNSKHYRKHKVVHEMESSEFY